MAPAKNPMRRSWLDDTDGGWVAHRLKLMVSPAWRHRPVPLMRILERIEIEHLRHGGAENGRLVVSYDQLEDWGVSRRAINGLLGLGETLGLLEVRQSGEWANDVRAPNVYRLTYVPEQGRRAPSDEWEQITNEQAAQAVKLFQKGIGKKPTPQCPNLHDTSAHSCIENPSTSAHPRNPTVSKRALTLISGGNAAKPEAVQDVAEEAPPPKGRDRRSNGQAGGVITDIPTQEPGVANLASPETTPCPNLDGGERALLRWLVNFDGPATHRKAQQNLSGSLKGEVISTVAKTLAERGLIRIGEKGRSRIYILLDAGRDPALLSDANQLDLENWLSTAAQ